MPGLLRGAAPPPEGGPVSSLCRWSSARQKALHGTPRSARRAEVLAPVSVKARLFLRYPRGQRFRG